ncbi:MAG: hypothetical protein AB1656_11525 [Candidatus Omnitrophota bacterium]
MNEQDLRKHIDLLANGGSDSILSEMKKEIKSIEETIQRQNTSEQNIQREFKNIILEVGFLYKKAEKSALPLDTSLLRIQRIEAKPPIKRYLQLAQELSQTDSSRTHTALNREFQFIKMQNAKDLSDIVSNQHQALVHRLNLINCWKTLMMLEIKILKQIKELISINLIRKAQETNDPGSLEFILEKLNALETDPHSLRMSDIDKSTLAKSNLAALMKTLREQLNEVIVIGKTLIEKQTVYESLQSVVGNIKEALPSSYIQESIPSEQPAAVAAEETPADASAVPPEKKSTIRMAFTSQSRKES